MTEKDTQDTKQETKTTLGLSRPSKLELKKTVESGEVRQSFSHGRSKAVQVQVKKKRTFKRGQTGGMKEVAAPETTLEAKAEAFMVAKAAPVAARPATLTETERAARVEAVRGALEAQVEEKVQAEEDTRRRAEEDARLAKDATEAEARRVADEAAAAEAERLRLEAEVLEAQKSAAGAAKPSAKKESKPTSEDRAPPRRREAESGAAAAARRKGEARRLSIGRRGEPPRRRSGKMTVVQALSEHERQRSLASMRRQREREKRAAGGQTGESRKVVREVVLPETITVQELANRMAVRGAEVVKALMKMDVMATINQTIDSDTAELVVNEFGHRIKRVSESDVEIGLGGVEDAPDTLKPRPPVVTVMGHVDHGKTSLLDALRESDVASGEAGGITQHIAAYQVTMASGDVITFLDTPGHEAFTQMRSRGAKATDLIVLVVAADDGVMPQTAEAIQHAQAAEVPMIIAINKMDRPDANPDKVKNALLQHNVVVESMGGEVLTVEISAKEKTNLDKLEEIILLQAELLELKANPDRTAEGVVLEAKRDRGRGIVATVLVQRGTLRIGDVIVAGAQYGKVRAMVDDRGTPVKEAYPSQPVEVLGLNDAPLAGDDLVVVESESRAREVAEYRREVIRRRETVAAPRSSIDEMFSRIAEGETKELPIVIKADVQGSLEAIKSSLSRFDTDEVAIRFLLAGVGGINESDISLANSSKALVLGFNVRADAPARAMARRDGLDIRYYSVIYELIEDMTNMLTGMLVPRIRENFIGYARVKQVFNITKVGKIAGCEVTEGVVRRGAKVRLLRDNVVIHEGTLSTLKRHKDEVAEVKQGLECGMAFENYHDLKEGDMIEAFELEEIARRIGD